MTISGNTETRLRSLQRAEVTLARLFRRMAEVESDAARRTLLLQMTEECTRHAAVLQRLTGAEAAPDRWRLARYSGMLRLCGPLFVLRMLRRYVRRTARCCRSLCAEPALRPILDGACGHEQRLSELVGTGGVVYIGSVVLGLNDALVEFTGALAGFTLVLNDPRLVALTGGITGIAAALSMAASEYLSTKASCPAEKHPLRAAICTGVAYLLTVAVLVAPYLCFSNLFWALGTMLAAALAVIALFNYYYAVMRNEPFGRRFCEMALLSFGVAGVSFLIGYLLKGLTGLEL